MYNAPTPQDSKTLQTLLRDAARFPHSTRWASLQEFNTHMGPRPPKAALLKRNTRTGHGPGNSYWSTDESTEATKAQAKATRAAHRQKKVPNQHPQTKTALKAALAALAEPPPRKFRVRTEKEQNEQVALLYAALSPPDDGSYY